MQLIGQTNYCVRCNRRRFSRTFDFTQKRYTQPEPIDMSKADVDKCQHVIRQLESILDADKQKREAEKQKLMQGIEVYKVQLRDTMKNKLKKVKGTLKEINDKETDASTRLALLQNKQLLTELEYQAKQTEGLISQNEKLEEQVVELKREIELHKQVELELARNSNAKYKQIITLSNKLKERVIKPKVIKEKGEINEEVTIFLETKLEEAEKKYAEFQNKYKTLHDNYTKQEQAIEKMKDKYNKAGSLLVELLEKLSKDMMEERKSSVEYIRRSAYDSG